jgi:hypothetical protein
VSLICTLQIQCNHLHNRRKVGLGLEGDCGQKVKIGRCSKDMQWWHNSKSSRNVYKKEWKLQTKGSTDGTIRVLSCRKDRFLNRENPQNCGYGLMMTMTKKERSTLSMFDRYNKSIYNVVGSCMMWWFMKFEWLAYGDESLLCAILHVYSTALSNFFLSLLHSESMRKIPTMRHWYCFIFVGYISFDVGFYLLPSHVSEMLW